MLRGSRLQSLQLLDYHEDCFQAAILQLLDYHEDCFQVAILQLLDYHVDWLEQKSTFTYHQGRWLYALLTCVELPLIPETCSTVRTLARECSRIRATLCLTNFPLSQPSRVEPFELVRTGTSVTLMSPVTTQLRVTKWFELVQTGTSVTLMSPVTTQLRDPADETTLDQLNFFICLVTKYFRQYDLGEVL
uniref:Uncharacterized protein n=1 Tax=Timema douglasi TaxID=61478 RepID=A0A7R8VVJ0_TIMDO|nr:unnamed protein product [Timema douglasi]